MTEAQKDAIREDFLTMSAVEIARKHTITRAYVHMIVAQPPDEAKRAIERAHGLDHYGCDEIGCCVPGKRHTNDCRGVGKELDLDAPDLQQPDDRPIVRFRKKTMQWLEDSQLQSAIRSEPLNYSAIACKYGTTINAVERIRKNVALKPMPKPFSLMSSEQRSEALQKRSEALKKSWLTRRLKYPNGNPPGRGPTPE